METNTQRLSKYGTLFDREKFKNLNEVMTYSEYLDRVFEKPRTARNSFQYIYDMILRKGFETFERYRKTHVRYKFFSDDNLYPIIGLEETIDALMNYIHGAAGGFGADRRVLLLHGPVGSSKSTICRSLKKGLEEYSRTDDGAWYTYEWYDLPDGSNGGKFLYPSDTDPCPMHQDPIKLMPLDVRTSFFEDLNKTFNSQIEEERRGLKPEEYRKGVYKLSCEGEVNPRSRLFLDWLMKEYNGDWERVMSNHVRVVRRCHSEIDRIGIGTFQPKDAKNQDSTELTGDLNFQKIASFGADSDPRAFNFDGEFEVAERGLLEFIEVLKLDNEFLYDLLGATQEHQVKPKKFAQVCVNEMIIGHTNTPEFDKLRGNDYMEALRDRTIKVDVPYVLRWSDETKIYEKDYGIGKIPQHMMPHTLEVLALFAVLTRLEDDPESKLKLIDKAKLYDDQLISGWSEDSVKELKDKNPQEGLSKGVSPRFIQVEISNCLAQHPDYVNIFMILGAIKERLSNSTLITKLEDIKHYEYCISVATKELDNILKNEVQKALVANEDAIVRLCSRYIDNMIASINNEKIVNPITKKLEDPDEKLMRSIEEKIKVTDQGSPQFRHTMATFITTLHHKKQEFSWKSNPDLRLALERKIFEDTKDHIKITSLSSESDCVDPDLQEKIEAIKTRLIDNYGYDSKSAKDVLDYVSSIFARGEADNDD